MNVEVDLYCPDCKTEFRGSSSNVGLIHSCDNQLGSSSSRSRICLSDRTNRSVRVPDFVWLEPRAAEFYSTQLTNREVEYRRVDPPAAPEVNPLTEDRCMFCGGKTAHKPDCDHGRPTPAAPDERDKALVEAVAAPWICVENKPCEEATPVHWEELVAALEGMLATVRAETLRDAMVDLIALQPTGTGNFRRGCEEGIRIAIRQLESARTGKVEG